MAFGQNSSLLDEKSNLKGPSRKASLPPMKRPLSVFTGMGDEEEDPKCMSSMKGVFEIFLWKLKIFCTLRVTPPLNHLWCPSALKQIRIKNLGQKFWKSWWGSGPEWAAGVAEKVLELKAPHASGSRGWQHPLKTLAFMRRGAHHQQAGGHQRTRAAQSIQPLHPQRVQYLLLLRPSKAGPAQDPLTILAFLSPANPGWALSTCPYPSKHFTCIDIEAYKNPVRQAVHHPHLQKKNWGTERLINLLTVTQLLSGRTDN